jgi:hypothetical protein
MFAQVFGVLATSTPTGCSRLSLQVRTASAMTADPPPVRPSGEEGRGTPHKHAWVKQNSVDEGNELETTDRGKLRVLVAFTPFRSLGVAQSGGANDYHHTLTMSFGP